MPSDDFRGRGDTIHEFDAGRAEGSLWSAQGGQSRSRQDAPSPHDGNTGGRIVDLSLDRCSFDRRSSNLAT